MKKQWFAGLLVGLACVCGAQQGSVGSGAAPAAPTPAATPTPAAGMAKATPAIWRVKGTHGTVYLFGSVHVMKPDVEWEAGKVKAAFDLSREKPELHVHRELDAVMQVIFSAVESARPTRLLASRGATLPCGEG